MQFREGAIVVTADGEKVGDIRQIVIDIDTQDVSHLVVGEGVLLPRDSLVPVNAVERTDADGDTVFLRPGAEPKEFAVYVADRFDTVAVGGRYAALPSGYVIHPIPTVPPVPAPKVSDEYLDAVTGSTLLTKGTPVYAVDGKRVGKAEEVLTLEDGSLDAVVVKRGILWFTRRRVVPAGWIRSIERSEIRLAVTRDQVMTEDREPSTASGQLPPRA